MKILSAQTDLGNATNVSNASVVRVFNSDSSNLLVTRKTSGGTTIGSFMVPTGEAVYCEKDYTDTLESTAAVKASKTAFSPMMSFVSQTTTGSSSPTYTYSVSSTSLDEGDSFTTTVTTTNVDDGTVLYWELSGTNITANDFSSGALTGSGTISNNTFNFSHTVSLDATTEGAETILVKVYSDSGRNTQVGNTVNVNVADTSLTRTYTTSLSVTTADEGDTFTTTMTTTNVANGTVLYWELSGTNIASGDFSSGALTGSGTISSNTFNFSHTIAEDNSTEGTETISIKFYSDSGRNTQVGSTATVTINDTSVAATSNYSVEFDGSGDYLSIPSSSDLTFGTGDFTIEFWAYADDFESRGTFYDSRGPSSTTGITIGHEASSGQIRVYMNAGHGGDITAQTDDFSTNAWYHIAVTRSSGSVKLFVNGVLKSTTTRTSNLNSDHAVNIGFRSYTSSSYTYFDGKIFNLRVVKGQALYTSSFTPSTEALTTTSQSATASNVKLLCCNESTATGNTVTTSIVPGGDPTASSDSDINVFASGKVGFDGSDDYLSLANSTDFDFGSGDFTIEFWLYPNSNSGITGIVGKRTSGGAANTNFVIYQNGLGMKLWFSDGSNYFINEMTTSNSLNHQDWNHVAVVRNGTSFKVYMNGTQVGSTTSSSTIASASRPLYIGCDHPGNVHLNGFLSNLRIVKGQALYTSNFTPSTSTLTTTSQGATASNVKLLCCKSSSSVTAYDVAPNNITASGDTVSKTDNPFSGNDYSVKFDGAADYLEIADSTDLEIAGNQFTMECWFYQINDAGSGASTHTLLSKWDNDGRKEFIWRISSNNGNQVLHWLSSSNGSSNDTNFFGDTNITNNAWHHAAVTRDSNGTIRMFVDGVVQSTTGTGGTTHSNTHEFMIGANGSSNIQQHMDGYISNVRVVMGQSLYANGGFTVPTEPLTKTSQGATASNVKLLCLQGSLIENYEVSPHSIDRKDLNGGAGPTVDNKDPFTTTGGAVDFNGGGYNSGGESLAIASNSSLDLGSGSFTIEAWVKMDSTQGTSWNVLACSSGYLFGTGVKSWNIYVYSTTGLRIYDSSGGPGENWTMVYGNDSLFNNSSWTHIAWTRSANGDNTSNNNNTVWINGVGQGSFSNRDNSYSDGQALYIGSSDYTQNGNIDEYGFDGAISNFRFTKGQVLYTSNFTPTTSPLTTTSQGATASNVSVLGLQHPSIVTSFAKSPSTPTVTGTPTVTTGPF